MIDWTDQMVDRICEELSGGRPISDIVKEDWAPSEPSIYRRMAVNEEFAARIAKARAAQQDFEADQCVTMADRATNEDWQVVRLRIWARQWRASKLASKKYGEALQMQHSGGVTLAINIVKYGDYDPKRLDAQSASIAAIESARQRD